MTADDRGIHPQDTDREIDAWCVALGLATAGPHGAVAGKLVAAGWDKEKANEIGRQVKELVWTAASAFRRAKPRISPEDAIGAVAGESAMTAYRLVCQPGDSDEVRALANEIYEIVFEEVCNAGDEVEDFYKGITGVLLRGDPPIEPSETIQ